MKKRILVILLFVLSGSFLFSGEAIHSAFDNYYDALSLQGKTKRPYLNYRAYSTDNWIVKEGQAHPWKGFLKAPKPLLAFDWGAFYLEDSRLFQSFNLQTPHGMNDEGLWQGRGYNLALKGGVSFKSPYLDIVLYPEFYFSQNREFDIMTASSWSGSEYGYPYSGIDTPQRFGNGPYVYGGWGQSQIRVKYKNWNLGFGTQNVWIGPASHSAILWSNNASGFPHIDIGLDRSQTKIGDFEFHMWWGWLKSSPFYKRSDANAYKDFITGITLSYAPSFIPGFTLGLHKTSQVALDNFDAYALIASLDPGVLRDYGTGSNEPDAADGRASITWSWLLPSAGFEFYGEWLMEDFADNLEAFVMTPEHAAAYTLGIKQRIMLKGASRNFLFLNCEISSLNWSLDYYINSIGWGGGFFRHYRTHLGYANKGQGLGSGVGTGGEFQHIEVDYYGPFGMAGVYVTRHRLDSSRLYLENNMVKYTGKRTNDLIPLQWAFGSRFSLFLEKGFFLDMNAALIYDMNRNLERYKNYYGFYVNLSLDYRY